MNELLDAIAWWAATRHPLVYPVALACAFVCGWIVGGRAKP